MPKLNQINAVVSARKNEAEKAVTELYKLIQKEQLFVGRERTYRPLDEVNGQKLPPESQRAQQRVDDLIRQAREKWTELWNLVLTQARGTSRPARHRRGRQGHPRERSVTTLLFLDKQVNDLRRSSRSCRRPTRGRVELRPQLGPAASKATERSGPQGANGHREVRGDEGAPAQTELFTKDAGRDVDADRLQRLHRSGPKHAILARVRKLQDAIKAAKSRPTCSRSSARRPESRSWSSSSACESKAEIGTR